jgi:hypothetical protein
MRCATRRRFSTSTIRSVIATAHNSPMVRRLDGLIRAHEAQQQFRIEAAVGVRDESPGNAEHPRETGEWALGELGQLR